MSDHYIEKSLLFLVVVSLLLHVGVFAALYYLPQFQKEPPNEPVFIDLQQMPQLKQPDKPRQQETKRRSDQRQRVPRETAPRGDAARESRPTVAPSRPQKEQPAA